MYKSKLERLIEETEKAQEAARRWKMVAEARLSLLEEAASAYRTTALRFRVATAGVVPSSPSFPRKPDPGSSGEQLYRSIIATDLLVRAGCDLLGPVLLDVLDAEAVADAALPIIQSGQTTFPGTDGDDLDEILDRCRNFGESVVDIKMRDGGESEDGSASEDDESESSGEPDRRWHLEEEIPGRVVDLDQEGAEASSAIVPVRTTIKSF